MLEGLALDRVNWAVCMDCFYRSIGNQRTRWVHHVVGKVSAA